MTQPNLLSASEAVARMRAGQLSVEDLALSCFARIDARDAVVKGWVALDRDRVLVQARELDRLGPRGPLHGLPIAVKDVIQTQDLPTRHNSPLYQDSFPAIDAGCVRTLRAAGALIFGKTDTTEFAATVRGGRSRNPHDSARTPGGSSSGSAAVVADCQVPIGLGTQTGGSTIRPASFCGVYALKATWGAINREGLKMLSPTLDTLGLYARSVADLDLLADVFDLEDRVSPKAVALAGARVAACRSPVWPKAEAATRAAFDTGIALLRRAGADVVDLDLPPLFDTLPDHHTAVMHGEARATFLSEDRFDHARLHDDFRAMVENRRRISKAALLEAYDVAAQGRMAFDAIAADFDAVLTPSAVGEAPVGEGTGDASFNSMWTLLHVPVVNLPGFVGPAGMPVGLSLVAGRYRDRHLLGMAKIIGPLFEAQGATHAR
ncbi:amidase [Lichenifustis flavocetrariae]|uniref:Amidase n=1 Tax=Lichenifustis flavocetrariae TaxID=2949735 RepID=A0AA42CKT3_9HYPH|nr:amidase [Lichenifustis flavocetrariae]MCW6506620.1 amidase [Lichenifustis flavocetrariae]